MMAFDNYHAITVPEGEVKHIIDSSGRRLWRRRRHAVTDKAMWHTLTDAADEPMQRLTVFGQTVYGDNLADMQAAVYPEAEVLNRRFAYFDKPYWLYYFNVNGDLLSMDEGLTSVDGVLTFEAGRGEEEGCGQLIPITAGLTYGVRFETTCRKARLYQLADGILRGSAAVSSGDFFVPGAGVNGIIVGFFPMDGSQPGQTDITHTVSALQVRPVSGIENPVVSVYGKNIMSNETMISNGWKLQEDGSFYATGAETLTKVLYQGNGQAGAVTISYDYKTNSMVNRGVYPYIYYADGSTEQCWPLTEVPEYTHFKYTTTSKKTIDRIVWTYGARNVQTWIKNIQVELGSAETEYEPCTKQTVTVSATLRPGQSAEVTPLALRTSTPVTHVVSDAPCVVEYILEEE